MFTKQVISPENKVFSEGQLRFTPPIVLLSSTSPRRAEFVEQMFGGKTAVKLYVESGEEPLLDEVLVAGFKAQRLHDYLKQQRLLNQHKDCLIVAADTRTSIPGRDGLLVSKGKPMKLEELQDNFSSMRDFSISCCEDPFYQVSSGAVTRLVRAQTFESETKVAANVMLDFAGVSFLATDEGMERYLEIFDLFYSSKPYSEKNMGTTTVHSLSGGMSLPVLMKLCVVRAINGVGINDAGFKDVYRDAVHTVAIGMPPELFRPYNTQVHMRYRNWEWLNNVVALSQDRVDLYA